MIINKPDTAAIEILLVYSKLGWTVFALNMFWCDLLSGIVQGKKMKVGLWSQNDKYQLMMTRIKEIHEEESFSVKDWNVVCRILVNDYD